MSIAFFPKGVQNMVMPCTPAEEVTGQPKTKWSCAITKEKAVAMRGKILSHSLETLLALGFFFLSFLLTCNFKFRSEVSDLLPVNL